MSAFTPYRPLDVLFGGNKVDGTRWFVRDAEDAQFWLMVEYVDRRLTCYCDDGQAHAETPDTEPECPHLRAVVAQRENDARTIRRSAAPINLAAWID